MRIAGFIVLTLLAGASQSVLAALSVTPSRALYDHPLTILVTGVRPGARVTLVLKSRDADHVRWRSMATFVADAAGAVDVTRTAPLSGSYKGVHRMGLFWSMTPVDGKPLRFAYPAMGDHHNERPATVSYVLTARTGRKRLGSVAVTRLMMAPDVTITRIRRAGLVANLFVPRPLMHDGRRHAAMIAIGGAEGGLAGGDEFARWLASHGYVVLSLAWYHAKGLNNDLVAVPVDVITRRALDFLSHLAYVAPNRIGIIGGSWGGTFAMAAAAHLPSIHAVVSFVGSVVPFMGLDREANGGFRPVNKSPFTIDGRPVAFATYSQLMRYLDHGNPRTVRLAATHVWNIHGPVLLIAGSDDELGASAPMAKLAMRLLEAHHHPYPDAAIVYPGAGHLISAGYAPTRFMNQKIPGIPPVGGNETGYARADADCGAKTLTFLAAALKHGDQHRIGGQIGKM